MPSQNVLQVIGIPLRMSLAALDAESGSSISKYLKKSFKKYEVEKRKEMAAKECLAIVEIRGGPKSSFADSQGPAALVSAEGRVDGRPPPTLTSNVDLKSKGVQKAAPKKNHEPIHGRPKNCTPKQTCIFIKKTNNVQPC